MSPVGILGNSVWLSYMSSMTLAASVMSTSWSCPPASCQRPLIILDTSSDPAMSVRSGSALVIRPIVYLYF